MATKVKEPTDEIAVDPVAAPVIPTVPEMPTIAAIPGDDGWYGDADWIRVSCEWPALKPRDGFEPIWAEFDATLSFREATSIPTEAGVPLIKLFAHIAPRIRAWNVREFDADSGQMVPVPPPMEIGTEALMRCRGLVVEWLAYTLRSISLFGGPNRKNEPSTSDELPATPNDVA